MSAADRVKQYVLDHKDESYLSWQEVADELDGEMLFYNAQDQDRWSTLYEGVIKFDDGFVRVTRGHGSTEYQDNDELTACLDDVVNVEPYDVTVTKYREVR